MFRALVFCITLLLAAPSVKAQGEPEKTTMHDNGDKVLSGMSIVGNDEAPKSLVIVPWKASALGDVLNAPRALEDGRGPVDREVFMRQLNYYDIRAASHTASRSGPR
jgi:hypothetical protein